jgi:hypothetical protein
MGFDAVSVEGAKSHDADGLSWKLTWDICTEKKGICGVHSPEDNREFKCNDVSAIC